MGGGVVVVCLFVLFFVFVFFLVFCCVKIAYLFFADARHCSLYKTASLPFIWDTDGARGLVFCAFLFSFISYTSLKVPGLCKAVCEWCKMKSVTIVKVLVVVFAFSRTCVSGVFLSPDVEHGRQGGLGTGTQQYVHDFLLSLQSSQAPSDFSFELSPAEMTNRKNVRKR